MKKNQDARSDLQELAGVARARAAFYAFLNLHFTTLPDEKFVRRLRNGEFNNVLETLQNDASGGEDILNGAALMSAYLEKMQAANNAQLVQDLGVDRTRLYRGVAKGYGPPPPYEMVWMREAQDFSILQVVAGAYRQVGLEPSPEVKERLDYISVEMDFIRELALREAAAWERGDATTARSLLATQEAFMRQHLGSWAPDFIEKGLEHAKTDFYRGHLYMLRGFINNDRQDLAELVEGIGAAQELEAIVC
jgi:putative dimethyl sulfoxide reductase chaperone